MFFKEIRRSLATIFFAAASLSTMAQTAQEQGLVVTTQSGEQVIIALSSKPVVTFDENEVIISATNKRLSYTLADKVVLQFCQLTGVGIAPTNNVQAIVSCDGATLKITHAAPNCNITIYNAAGIMLHQAKADKQGTATFTLDKKDIYIMRVGNLTIKITN